MNTYGHGVKSGGERGGRFAAGAGASGTSAGVCLCVSVRTAVPRRGRRPTAFCARASVGVFVCMRRAVRKACAQIPAKKAVPTFQISVTTPRQIAHTPSSRTLAAQSWQKPW